MKALCILGYSTLTVAMLAPMIVLAGSPGTRVGNYAQFNVSAADVAAMTTDADTACQTNAAATPNDLAPQVACNTAMTARLDARIREATKWKLRTAPSRAQRQVITNQNNWATNRQAVCEAKWAGELNPSSTSFGLAVSKCVAQETYRRTLWVESRSRN